MIHSWSSLVHCPVLPYKETHQAVMVLYDVVFQVHMVSLYCHFIDFNKSFAH